MGTRSLEMTHGTSEWGQVDATVTGRKRYLGGRICRPSQFDSCGMRVRKRSQGCSQVSCMGSKGMAASFAREGSQRKVSHITGRICRSCAAC